MKLKYFSVLATLLGTLALENINVEGLNSLNLSNLTNGNENFSGTTSLTSINIPSNTSAVAAAEQKDTNDIGQIASSAQETADAVRAKQVHPLNQYSMMVISKYFNSINDYINIEKCCKEYNGIIEQFKYNPILFENEKERELFKNIETWHFYTKDEVNEEKKIIEGDTRIKQFIHWEEKISYSNWKENKKENEVYKNIEFGKDDMKKYLLDHEEGYEVFLKEENVVLEEGITSIGNECFRDCNNLRTITIPTTVSSIGDYSFNYCDNLSTINIPTSVTSIGKRCFTDCTSLSTINISTGVLSIGNSCFADCTNLSTINIPTSVSSIGRCCFASCSNLNTINIPTSVSSIGEWCFNRCYNLSKISTQQENTDQLKNLLPDELKDKVKGENQQKEEGKK